MDIICTATHGENSGIPMTDLRPALRTRWQKGMIAKILERTPSIKSFMLRLSAPFDYQAGQHVDVRLTAPKGDVAVRSYSIASAPSTSGILELAIERLSGGEVSPFFHDVARTGDEIELRGPLGGHFIWPRIPSRPVLLIGAGPVWRRSRRWSATGVRARTMPRQRYFSPHAQNEIYSLGASSLLPRCPTPNSI